MIVLGRLLQTSLFSTDRYKHWPEGNLQTRHLIVTRVGGIPALYIFRTCQSCCQKRFPCRPSGAASIGVWIHDVISSGKINQIKPCTNNDMTQLGSDFQIVPLLAQQLEPTFLEVSEVFIAGHLSPASAIRLDQKKVSPRAQQAYQMKDDLSGLKSVVEENVPHHHGIETAGLETARYRLGVADKAMLNAIIL
jgi:hypothetical protein